MSIYKKLHELQSSTRSLAANAEGQTGSARYGYISGSKLLGVVRPMMDKLGLILTEEIVGIENTPITYMTRSGEKTEMFTSLHIRFTWTDTEDGSQVVNEFYANGMNAWDKGLGSALTYAERYYLLKTFHIATDEDDVDALIKEDSLAAVVQTDFAPEVAPKPEPTPETKRRRATRAKASTPVEAYKPVAEEIYWKLVESHAKGVLCPSGMDCRTKFIELTNPGEVQLKEFDHNVENVRIANGY